MSKPVIVIPGRVGKDPEAVGNGGTKFSVACDVGTAKKPQTDWYNIVIWSNTLAEFVNKWIKKGSSVIVTGTLTQTKKDEKTYYNVTANGVDFGVSGSGKKSEDGEAAVSEEKQKIIDEGDAIDII